MGNTGTSTFSTVIKKGGVKELKNMNKIIYLHLRVLCFLLITTGTLLAQAKKQDKTLWQIGLADNSAAEFALAPSGHEHFLEKDFGWENKFYLIYPIGRTEWQKTGFAFLFCQRIIERWRIGFRNGPGTQ